MAGLEPASEGGGIKSLSKGIRVEMAEDTVTISVTVNLVYGYNIPCLLYTSRCV